MNNHKQDFLCDPADHCLLCDGIRTSRDTVGETFHYAPPIIKIIDNNHTGMASYTGDAPILETQHKNIDIVIGFLRGFIATDTDMKLTTVAKVLALLEAAK